MRTFQVKVNGVPYQVEVEEVAGGFAAPPQAAPAPAAAPVPAAAPIAPAAAPVLAPAAPAATPVAGGEKVNSPMPGTILDIKAAAGQSVTKGEVLCILEAMKMENEIISPRDGVIAQVVVSKGASVNAGDPLMVLQ